LNRTFFYRKNSTPATNFSVQPHEAEQARRKTGANDHLQGTKQRFLSYISNERVDLYHKGGRMKILKITAVFLLALPLLSSGQQRIQADDIIGLINDNRPVRFQNAVIVGDLDFSTLENVTADKPLRKLLRGVFRQTQTYTCHIESPLSFIDCTFEGDVLAYVHDERKNETYNAVFYEDVSFEGCEFKRDSAFKYAKFTKEVNFENTEYSEEALFKYTKFSTEVSYAGSKFGGQANFKYTKFPEGADFSRAVFNRYADFKYSKFPEGVDFEGAEFRGTANFKYAKFSEPLNFEGVEFDGETDFKYTSIDGRSFTSYLLKRR
jgi:uncharacterized protein YjbI with pentapeptide repeats